jgi:hypothetical protein
MFAQEVSSARGVFKERSSAKFGFEFLIAPPLLGNEESEIHAGNNGRTVRARGRAQPPFAVQEKLSFFAGLDCASSAQSSVTAFELVHTPGRVDKFLFAGEKGVARGADTDFDVLAGRARAIRRTAGTNDDGFDVIGMNRGLHFCENLSS